MNKVEVEVDFLHFYEIKEKHCVKNDGDSMEQVYTCTIYQNVISRAILVIFNT